ncbi:hypothetical protein KBZ33_18730, partial [Cyanobium sp. Cruz-8D1]|nr:hypothetical protein [Cyanobium sp. Cruz-8H5]MCP9868301.1 hypothetical protein [Cyanobium sp. Cruz-8D1]
MNNFATSQEEFWAGEFGSAYIDRNNSKEITSSNVVLFSNILANLNNIDSVLELGCNVGLNLDARNCSGGRKLRGSSALDRPLKTAWISGRDCPRCIHHLPAFLRVT